MMNTSRFRFPRYLTLGATLLALAGFGSACNEDSAPTAKPPAARTTSSSGKPSATAPASGLQVGGEKTDGVDDEDAPDAPRALPRSGQVGGWIKSRAIEVRPVADQITRISDEYQRRAIRLFAVQRIATCEYRLGTARAEVLFVEADTPEALGIFSVLSENPAPLIQPDGSLRGRGAGLPHVLTAWQGQVFVQIVPGGVMDAATAARAEQLLSRIIFALPAAETPLLMRIIPTERRARCRVWVTRRAEALRLLKIPALKSLPADEVNRQLGLGPDAVLSVAAVDVVPGDPHLIWLVEYGTAAQATAAHARCLEEMKNGRSPLATSLLVELPHGPYLAGTWTRQQEALQPLLPLLTAALPEADTAATRPAVASSPAQ